jgi:hypothetical protein
MTSSRKRPQIWLPPGDLQLQLTPIIGKQAKRQLLEVKADDRGLARRLTERIVGLLDDGVIFDPYEIPDPPRIGPRYLVDLGDGYVAIYWVVRRPGHRMPLIWVEQVMSQSTAEGMLTDLAPSEEG